MHKKINVDYFKNKLDKLPPVQLPKIKSRKIFSAKSSTENVPPPLPKVPPPTIVDRSPVTISTISALVEGAPQYDYSFGGAEVPDEIIERHLKEDTKKQAGDATTKRTKGFSEKLTKHYKEFSEFKFKNILGKKTIVRTTEIQVDMYKERYEEANDGYGSEQSDYDDFDVHSIPTDRRAYTNSPLPTRESLPNIKETEDDETLQNNDNDIEPIESTLYQIKKRAESIEFNENVCGAADKDSTTKDTAKGSRSSHRQVFDDACGRAKKAVNSKFQKLLQLRSKGSQDSVPSAPEVKPTYKRSNTQLPKQTSAESGRESLDSSREASVDYNPSIHDWTSRRILSTDSNETPRCLKARYSPENSDEEYSREVLVTHRPAPPIPKFPKSLRTSEWVPNSQIITAFHNVTPPMMQNRNFFVSDISRGHTRKPSMDSVDSDSWIPETYKNNRSPIGLNKIEENIEPWNAKSRGDLKKLKKMQSVDIFTGDECEKVFEDFDDALKNVPVIPIVYESSEDASLIKTERPSRPLVQQSSLTRHFSDDIEAENLNINVNKLISQFEPNLVYQVEKIKVTAVVEMNRDQSPAKSPVKNITSETVNSPCAESFRSNTIKRKPISAKEWALRAKASRSLEPGAQGSDEIFYSFDSGYKPPSPRKVIRRHVYRIDL